MSEHVRNRARGLVSERLEGTTVRVNDHLIFLPQDPAASGLPLAKCDCEAGRHRRACAHALRAAEDHLEPRPVAVLVEDGALEAATRVLERRFRARTR